MSKKGLLKFFKGLFPSTKNFILKRSGAKNRKIPGFGFLVLTSQAETDAILRQKKFSYKGRLLRAELFFKKNGLEEHRQEFLSRRVFIGSIPTGMNNSELKTVIEAAVGPVESAYSVVNCRSQNHMGFGYAIMVSEQDARRAVRIGSLYLPKHNKSLVFEKAKGRKKSASEASKVSGEVIEGEGPLQELSRAGDRRPVAGFGPEILGDKKSDDFNLIGLVDKFDKSNGYENENSLIKRLKINNSGDGVSFDYMAENGQNAKNRGVSRRESCSVTGEEGAESEDNNYSMLCVVSEACEQNQINSGLIKKMGGIWGKDGRDGMRGTADEEVSQYSPQKWLKSGITNSKFSGGVDLRREPLSPLERQRKVHGGQDRYQINRRYPKNQVSEAVNQNGEFSQKWSKRHQKALGGMAELTEGSNQGHKIRLCPKNSQNSQKRQRSNFPEQGHPMLEKHHLEALDNRQRRPENSSGPDKPYQQLVEPYMVNRRICSSRRIFDHSSQNLRVNQGERRF